MAFTYNYELTQFLNNKCDNNKFSDQIRNSTISSALDYISQSLGYVTTVFKAELTNSDVSTLDNLVANHDGEPIPDNTPIIKADVLTEHLKYVEKGDTTQGLFAAESILIDVSSGDSRVIVDHHWPFDTALMSGTLGVSDDMLGDDIEVIVGPNILVGALTQPLSVGDTSIYCSSTVIENMMIGYYMNLYSPTNEVELGQVINIDSANNCIEVHDPVDASANAGDYLSMSVKLIPYLHLNSNNTVEIGKQIPTGRRIPKNIPTRIIYTNNNGIAKKVSFFVEYFY